MAENEEDFTEPEGEISLQVARDVLKVWKHIGKATGRRALGSSSAKALHDWASNPENYSKFVVMAQKAEETMQKHAAPENDAEMTRVETLALGDIRDRLRKAIQESASVQV